MATSRTPSKQLGTSQDIKTMDCDLSLSVGDYVYQSPSVNNKALKASDNNTPTPVIGKAIRKPTTTTCDVLHGGVTSEASMSGVRGKIFVSASGSPTTTVPTSNYLQAIGFSYGDGKIFLDVTATRVKRA